MNTVAATPASIIKVLLVGSQPVSLAGLHALIDNEAGFDVVGQREHPRDVAAGSLPGPADVAVIDHTDHDRIDPLTTLAQGGTGHPPCLVLTASTEEALLAHAFRAGARGLVFKHQSPRVLIEAIAHVHGGDIWLDRAATTQLVAR